MLRRCSKAAPVLADHGEAGSGEEVMPARLCHPQPVLALVREGPGALVQAPHVGLRPVACLI